MRGVHRKRLVGIDEKRVRAVLHESVFQALLARPREVGGALIDEQHLARFGPRLLVVNRFIPGLRGLFLYAAGIGRMNLRPLAVYSTASNALWVTLLAWGGTRLGTTWGDVRAVFRRYVWGIAILVGVYLALSIARARRRRRALLTPFS